VWRAACRCDLVAALFVACIAVGWERAALARALLWFSSGGCGVRVPHVCNPPFSTRAKPPPRRLPQST
jgi:hypothetical protein